MKFSYLTKKAKAKDSSIHGRGVFATDDIQKEELIAIFGGRIADGTKVEELKKKFYKNTPLDQIALEVYDDYYLVNNDQSEVEDVDFFNHSCQPNAGIKGQIVLVPRRKIKAGQEITFDYATTDTHMGSLKCYCGSKNCRKVIGDNDWKKTDFQKRNKEYISYHVQQKIDKLKNGANRNKS